MAAARSQLARRVAGSLSTAVVLCLVGLAFAASAARADSWFEDGAPAPDVVDRYLQSQGTPDVLDRYLQTHPTLTAVPTGSPAAVDQGFQIDWSSVAIGVGIALGAGALVAMGVYVGRHGGPRWPVPHG